MIWSILSNTVQCHLWTLNEVYRFLRIYLSSNRRRFTFENIGKYLVHDGQFNSQGKKIYK